MPSTLAGWAIVAAVSSAAVGVVGAVTSAQQQNQLIQSQLDASQAQAAFQQRQANINTANLEIKQETARNNAMLAALQKDIETTRGEAQKAAEEVSGRQQKELLARELDVFRGRQRASLASRGLSGSASSAALQNAATGSAIRSQNTIDLQTFLNKASVDIAVANQTFSLSVQEAEQRNAGTQFGFEIINVDNSLAATLEQIEAQQQQLLSQARDPFTEGLFAAIQGASNVVAASGGFGGFGSPGSGEPLGRGLFSSTFNSPVTTSGTTSRFGGLPSGLEGFA